LIVTCPGQTAWYRAFRGSVPFGKRISKQQPDDRLSFGLVGKVVEQITFEDFLKVDVRVGTIIAVDEFPDARKPAYKLRVDFGDDIGVRKSSAQVTIYYTREELVGRQVVAVVNFPPRQIGKFMSEILVLGVPDDKGEVVLLQPDHKVPNGGRLF